MSEYKRCWQCKTTQPIHHFHNQKSLKDGKALTCKSCTKAYREANKEHLRAYAAEYRQKHRERILAEKRIASKIYYQKNKEKIAERERRNRRPESQQLKGLLRRARLKANGIYRVTRQEILALRSRPCFYCGSKGKVVIDHVIPVVRGGRHSIGNFVPACVGCNARKKDKYIMEWRLGK
jgi:5-methylcytosine-specific restriction endonuclease McrA